QALEAIEDALLEIDLKAGPGLCLSGAHPQMYSLHCLEGYIRGEPFAGIQADTSRGRRIQSVRIKRQRVGLVELGALLSRARKGFGIRVRGEVLEVILGIPGTGRHGEIVRSRRQPTNMEMALVIGFCGLSRHG